MPFSSPYPLKERILLYGSTGTGKTYAYLSICRALAQYGSPVYFNVISTDNGLPHLLYGEFPDLMASNLVRVFPAYDWPEYVSALAAAKAQSGPNDWLVCDLACKGWDAAQDYFTQKVYGDDCADYFLDVRAQFQKRGGGKSMGNPLDGRQDWPTIKKIFNSWADSLLMKQTCHVLCTAKAKPVDSKQDPVKIVEEYGRIGSKPAGNKDFPFDFNASLCLSRRHDGFVMRTHKDRGRRYVDEVFQNFAMSYLYGVAGWQVS